MFEYVMLAGVNDSAEDAHRLLLLTQHIECKYNLIEFNAHPGTRFQGSDPDTIQAFRWESIQSCADVDREACSTGALQVNHAQNAMMQSRCLSKL